MTNKRFAERLNKALDNIGVPSPNDERVTIFAKLLKIPRFKAEALLSGITLPNNELLSTLSQELEVTPEWLLAQDD